ncbi:hypothetical protein [Endozoicomonas sp. YOMI1]|uniref:hypothetical protein n=1 Tax=Endozoicomonas sp. YOMI1 TaxID=2828739 RepID=UPI002148CF8F|nr:hypothetical protein [Endozoicomonas sp. YOMI1]
MPHQHHQQPGGQKQQNHSQEDGDIHHFIHAFRCDNDVFTTLTTRNLINPFVVLKSWRPEPSAPSG